MRTILFCLLTILSLNGFASEKIVLLTSLELTSKEVSKVEGYFNKMLPPEQYETEIHHQVSPEDLLNHLNDKNVQALVWVSHAAQEKDVNSGIAGNDTILDAFGNNVKNFFSSPHREMKHLSVVGCNAKPILDRFNQNGAYSSHPDFSYFSFDRKTKIMSGLKLAVADLLKKLQNKKTIQVSPIQKTQKITVDLSYLNGAGWIEIGQKVIGYLDPQKTLRKTIEIETAFFQSLSNKNIHLYFDKKYDSSLMNGFLQLSSWKVFTDASGRPLGGSKQLYMYR